MVVTFDGTDKEMEGAVKANNLSVSSVCQWLSDVL